MSYQPPNGYNPYDPYPPSAPQQPAYPSPDYGQTAGYPPTGPYSAPTGPTNPYEGYPPPPNQAPPSQGLYGQAPVVYQPVMYQPVVQPGQGGGAAVAVEVIAGLFGFWGIGWLMRGYTTTGVLLLVGGLIFGAIMAVISIATFGAGLLCWGPLNLITIIVSAVTLSNRLKNGPTPI